MMDSAATISRIACTHTAPASDFTAAQPSEDRDPGHIRKRKKTSQACTGCQHRRTKCDLLELEGCYRCRSLGVECSFRIVVPTAWQGNVAVTPAITFLGDEPVRPESYISSALQPDHHISSLERRIEELEGLVGRGGRLDSFSDLPPAKPARPENQNGQTQLQWSERDYGWLHASACPETKSQVLQWMRAPGERGLVDPVGETGVITLEEAQAAYASFKFYASSLFPYQPYLLTSTTLPDHPFLRSCILVYLSRCPSPSRFLTSAQTTALDSNLERNLSAYASHCRASAEAVLGLYLLSLMPDGRVAYPTVAGDPARLIALAWQMSHELGWDGRLDAFKGVLQSGSDVRLYGEMESEMKVYLAVSLRHTWLSMARTPKARPPRHLTTTHKDVIAALKACPMATELDAHLAWELRLLEVMGTFLGDMALIERDDVGDLVERLNETHEHCTIAIRELDQMRRDLSSATLTSRPYLRALVNYMTWYAAAKAILFAHGLPSPLRVPVVIDGIGRISLLIRDASRSLITLYLEENWMIDSLPSAMGTAIIHAFGSSFTWITYALKWNPNAVEGGWAKLDGQSPLDRFARHLEMNGGGGVKERMANARRYLEKLREDTLAGAGAVEEAGAGTGGVEGFAFDRAALVELFGDAGHWDQLTMFGGGSEVWPELEQVPQVYRS